MIDTRAEFSLDGIRAAEIFSPHDPQELARVLADCNMQKHAVIPWGGGTMQYIGDPPTRMDAVIHTTGLNQVVEYEPADLTLSVEAGMTVAEIARTLAAHGQFLPIDVPHPDRATIGGALAAGASGSLRLHYGPPRDFTLGIRMATVDGHLIKAGGKVVKNVAGYELTKLVVGSLGTLGILTECTFKVFPLPQAESTLVAAFPRWQDACAAIPKLWNLPTPPLALEILDANVAGELVHGGILPDTEMAWLVLARFGGSHAVVQAARDNSRLALRDVGHETRVVEFVEHDVPRLWQTLADLPDQMAIGTSTVVRIGIPPKELSATLSHILALGKSQDIAPPRIFAHAASANIYAAFDAEAEKLSEIVRQLRINLAGVHGHLVIEFAPAEIKRTLNTWGEPGPEFKLMRAIKSKFDPNGILNPGRFIGGL